jgi:hypothetical protein
MKHTSAVPVFSEPVIAIVACRAMLIARGRAPDKTIFALWHGSTLYAPWHRIGPVCLAERHALPNHVVPTIARKGGGFSWEGTPAARDCPVFQSGRLARNACRSTTAADEHAEGKRRRPPPCRKHTQGARARAQRASERERRYLGKPWPERTMRRIRCTCARVGRVCRCCRTQPSRRQCKTHPRSVIPRSKTRCSTLREGLCPAALDTGRYTVHS